MTTPRTLKMDRPLDLGGNTLTGALNVTTFRKDVYANIGAASAHAGELFFATNDPVAGSGSIYESDGSTWTLITTLKGELASSELLVDSGSTSGTGMQDVPTSPLTINFTLATARDVEVCFRGTLRNSTADIMRAQIVALQAYTDPVAGTTFVTNAVVDFLEVPLEAVHAAGDYNVFLVGRIGQLAAGTWDFRVQLQAPSTGSMKITASHSSAVGKKMPRLWARLA